MFSSMLSLLGSLRRGNFVTNSLRFRSSASANLSRTLGTPTSGTTWTWSAWVKRGSFGVQGLLQGFTASNNQGAIVFNGDSLQIVDFPTTLNCTLITTQVFRDPSAWYHIVVQVDTTQATPSNRVRVYVNGSQVTSFSSAVYPGLNTVFRTVASGYSGSIGRYFDGANNYFDGYLTEVNFIDGQALTPSSFGQIESTTGVWSPKQYVGTYGANGFYLKFSDASAATAAAIGKDSSGNGNNWTPSGISVTAGVTYDSMIDVPVNYSDSGNGRGNYAVLNGVDNANSTAGTASDGNLRITSSGVTNGLAISRYSSLGASGINLYAEFTFLATSGSNAYSYVGVFRQLTDGTYGMYVVLQLAGSSISGRISTSAGVQQTGLGFVAANDIISITVTAEGSVTFYKNNIQIGISQALLGSGNMFFNAYAATGDAGASQASIAANFGQRPFTYTPTAGFRALNTNNLPTPSIVNGANFMAATTYTGNAAAWSLSNAVNNVSFQPDLVWIKSRTPGATSHALFDSVRGTGKYLSSDTAGGETTNANTLTAFNGDGFSLGTDTTIVNANANSYIAWQWKAGGNTTTNTSGTITSQVNANPTAGFSIVTYTGTGTNNPTIGHGLNEVPAMIILKNRDTSAVNWFVYHKNIGANYYILLNLPNQRALINSTTSGAIGTSPNSSTFTFASGTSNSLNGNTTGIKYVAYCFAEIAGFSRFGSYTGNGSPDGPFVFCGFRPRWVMYKSTTETTGWAIIDTSRNTSNVADKYLNPNDSTTEGTSNLIDVLSNGFKFRTIAGGNNASGQTYIYAAFAEVPSKYALAR